MDSRETSRMKMELERAQAAFQLRKDKNKKWKIEQEERMLLELIEKRRQAKERKDAQRELEALKRKHQKEEQQRPGGVLTSKTVKRQEISTFRRIVQEDKREEAAAKLAAKRAAEAEQVERQRLRGIERETQKKEKLRRKLEKEQFEASMKFLSVESKTDSELIGDADEKSEAFRQVRLRTAELMKLAGVH